MTRDATGSLSTLVNSKHTHDPTSGVTFDAWKQYRDHSCGAPVTVLEDTFRHSGWAADRIRIFEALQRLHKGSRVLERFAHCGAQTSIEQSKSGYRLACDHCRNRCCVPCGRARAAIIRQNLMLLLVGLQVRFVTLTLRHSHTPLSDQLDRLYRSFNVFRRRRFWTSHVSAGAAFVEVKVSDRDGLWHPHLHILVVGDFMDAKRLSQEWLAVTGDSSRTDISLVKQHDKVGGYVTKYVSKPLDPSVFLQPDTLDEAITALAGRRLCLTFGAWRGKPLSEVPDDGTEWHSLGSTATLAYDVRSGDVEAHAVLSRVLLACPHWAPLFDCVDLLHRSTA